MKKLFAILIALVVLLIPRDHLLAQTPTATPTAAYDFPVNPTVGQIVIGPSGQRFQWDGYKWIALLGGGSGGGGGGGGSVIIDPTPPSNPTAGQLWFNPVDLQTYVWYTDPTSSQWTPVVNLVGGGGGGGTVPPNSTIDSPTFTGTIQFPDGSYYDANGHEVMKNLGVGMVANVAGVGGVSGNSIVVAKSGWVLGNGPATADGFWDANGINQLYDVRSEYLDTGNPPTGTDGWTTVYADPENAAHNNAWGESDMYNYSAPDAESGRDQRWQPEGFQEINAIGIHQNTWQQGCTGSIISGAYLSDCALAALPSPLNNNVGYKIMIANPGTGASASALIQINTGSGSSIYPTYIQANGPGYTANPFYPPNSMLFDTSEPNGMFIGTGAGPNTVKFHIGTTISGIFNGDGLVLPNTSAANQIYFGSATTPNAAVASWGMGALELGAGEHIVSGSSPPHVADATAATIATHEPSGVLGFYVDTGLTVGTAYTPTEIGYFGPGGLNLVHGSFMINGTPIGGSAVTWQPWIDISSMWEPPVTSGQREIVVRWTTDWSLMQIIFYGMPSPAINSGRLFYLGQSATTCGPAYVGRFQRLEAAGIDAASNFDKPVSIMLDCTPPYPPVITLASTLSSTINSIYFSGIFAWDGGSYTPGAKAASGTPTPARKQ